MLHMVTTGKSCSTVLQTRTIPPCPLHPLSVLNSLILISNCIDMPFHERPLDLGFAVSLEAGLEDVFGSANECGV